MGRKAKEKLDIEELYRYPIAKSNDYAINSVFDFTLIEQKLVNYICTKVSKPIISDDNTIIYNLDYKVDFDEFCKMSGMKICGSSYQLIKKSLEGLMKKIINVKMPNGEYTGIHFLDRYAYAARKGYANVRIDDRMIPFIIALEKNFLKYSSKYGMLFNSKYSSRILEYLKAKLAKVRGGKMSALRKKYNVYSSDDITKLEDDKKKEYFSKHTRIVNSVYEERININLLKTRLFIGKSIEGYKMLYNRILKKSIEEINKLSDVYISIDFDNKTDDIIFKVRGKNLTELAETGLVIDKYVNDVYLGDINSQDEEDKYEPNKIDYTKEEHYDINGVLNISEQM